MPTNIKHKRRVRYSVSRGKKGGKNNTKHKYCKTISQTRYKIGNGKKTRKHKGGRLFSSLTSLFGTKKDPISVEVTPIDSPSNVQVARDRAMMQASKLQAERENLANIRAAARERARGHAAIAQAERENLANIRAAARERARGHAAIAQAERVKKANESAARIEAIRQKYRRGGQKGIIKNLKHNAESRIKTAKKRNLKGGKKSKKHRRTSRK